MVLPIMLALISGFIAIMIQVRAQQQLQSAVELAAASSFTVPRSFEDYDTQGNHNGFPTRCRYAAETFMGTMDFYTSDVNRSTGQPNWDQDNTSNFISFENPKDESGNRMSPVMCNYNGGSTVRYDGDGYNLHYSSDYVYCHLDAQQVIDGVTQNLTWCSASVTLHFDKTPLGWAIFWNPTITAQASAQQPPFRQ